MDRDFIDQGQQASCLIETIVMYEFEFWHAPRADSTGQIFSEETGRAPQRLHDLFRFFGVLFREIYRCLGKVATDPDLGNGQVLQTGIAYLPRNQGGEFPLDVIRHPLRAAEFPRHF